MNIYGGIPFLYVRPLQSALHEHILMLQIAVGVGPFYQTPTQANAFRAQVMNLIGDVKGKVAVMVDDMIDTAGKPLPRLKFLLVLELVCNLRVKSPVL